MWCVGIDSVVNVSVGGLEGNEGGFEGEGVGEGVGSVSQGESVVAK